MKYYFSTLLLLLFCISPFQDLKAQNMPFNHTMSNAAYGEPALAGFRETPILGWQYNDNNSFWKSSLVSVSVPFEKFGLQAAWRNDPTKNLQFNSLSLAINKVFEMNKFKVSVAMGFEGARRKYNSSGLVFSDKLHDRLAGVYDDPRIFEPRHQLAYAASFAIDFNGMMLFGTTRARTLTSTATWDNSPITSLGLGYHKRIGDWRIQALGTYTKYGPWSLGNEMITVRYRFIEFGLGGQQVTESGFYPKAQLGVVAERYKLSYVYLNKSVANSRVTSGFTWHEHEISLLIGLHRKDQKADFPLF